MFRFSGLLVVFILAGASLAQDYPTRPLTYTVPWSPGGGTDTTSRALAAVLQDALGTSVNVVNRTGGGGVVGHLALAQARPDGYTIGAVTVEITMMHHQGLTDLTYEDYTPLALIINNPAAVTVRADAPWNTLEELLAHIRQNPGELQASGTSRGGIWDLARIGMLDAAGLEESAMPWVPSQGAGPALQELLAGGVDVVTAALAEVVALLEAGEVKVLGVMSDQRLERFADVPTLAEQGVDWSIGGWAGTAAPAGLEEAVLTQLDNAIQQTLADPAFTEPLLQAGFNLEPMDAAEFTAFLAQQDEINGQLLELAGVTSAEGQ